MSRIGILPINIPSNVKVQVDGSLVSAEGPKGKMQYRVASAITPVLEDQRLIVKRKGNDARSKSLHGTSRTVLNNLVQGVNEGFVKKLEISGVGFRASLDGKTLRMHLGFSHPSVYAVPDEVEARVEENTRIILESPNKEVVGRVAAEIRNLYPAEPYKGKGVRYSDERIVRKEGKTVK